MHVQYEKSYRKGDERMNSKIKEKVLGKIEKEYCSKGSKIKDFFQEDFLECLKTAISYTTQECEKIMKKIDAKTGMFCTKHKEWLLSYCIGCYTKDIKQERLKTIGQVKEIIEKTKFKDKDYEYSNQYLEDWKRRILEKLKKLEGGDGGG